MTNKLYAQLASLVEARLNCIKANNSEWLAKHTEKLESLVETYLPSGSGFDSGTKLDLDASNGEKLVFTTEFHHMNENGMYDGWTDHTVTVKPSLAHGYSLTVGGRNRNDIKDYIHETFSFALDSEEWAIREAYLRQVETHPEIKISSRWIDQCWQVWDACGKEFKSYIEAMQYAVSTVS